VTAYRTYKDELGLEYSMSILSGDPPQVLWNLSSVNSSRPMEGGRETTRRRSKGKEEGMKPEPESD
jgi:hypothetical protein